jgi:hypothetical protein
LYARLRFGPIPDGPFDGEIVFPRGSSGKLRAAEIVGGLKGLGVNFKGRMLETAGEALWKGKVFYRDEKVLRNRIEDLALLRPLIGPGDIPKIDVDGKDAWLLFPAKLYCGQSLIDSRRESIIIDYAFTDEIAGLSRPRLPRRPARPQGARRNPHGASRPVSRPRLHGSRLHPELRAYNKDVDKVRRAEFAAGQIAETAGPAPRSGCWPCADMTWAGGMSTAGADLCSACPSALAASRRRRRRPAAARATRASMN